MDRLRPILGESSYRRIRCSGTGEGVRGGASSFRRDGVTHVTGYGPLR
jgi:hypothetical protein